MPLDQLECPSCGAPLAPAEWDPFACSYCGTKLRLGREPSSAPIARHDTAAHLQAELRRLRQEERRLRTALAAVEKAPGQATAGCLVLLGLWWVVGGLWVLRFDLFGALTSMLPGIGLLAFAGYLRQRFAAGRREATEGLEADLEWVSRKISDVREDLDAHRPGIDEVVRQV